MLFNSIEYLYIFLPLTFITYFTLNKYKLYNTSLIFLLLSSLYFYSTYNIKFTYIIILSTLLNYSINLLLNNKNLSKLKKPARKNWKIYSTGINKPGLPQKHKKPEPKKCCSIPR